MKKGTWERSLPNDTGFHRWNEFVQMTQYWRNSRFRTDRRSSGVFDEWDFWLGTANTWLHVTAINRNLRPWKDSDVVLSRLLMSLMGWGLNWRRQTSVLRWFPIKEHCRSILDGPISKLCSPDAKFSGFWLRCKGIWVGCEPSVYFGWLC